MSILQQVSNAPSRQGVRMVVAGVEKVGKTTFAASAPRPILVPLEVGAVGITVNKTPMLQKLQDTEQFIAEVLAACQAGQFPYQSIIFDSCTAFERQIHDSIIEADPSWAKGNKRSVTMESALGGYGRAYTYANERFDSFLKQCDVLAVLCGINIIFTAHVFAAKMMDPTQGEYDSWDLLLHSPKNQKTYGKREIITQWADVVGFMYEPMYITKSDNMSKGVSANKGRVMGLSRTPSYVAGNRYGVEGEVSIPRQGGWNQLAHAIYNASGIDLFNRDVN